jgi:hypothetical protein
MARVRSLAMARHKCRLREMAEWLEYHVAAIGLLNLNLGTCVRPLIKLKIGRGL